MRKTTQTALHGYGLVEISPLPVPEGVRRLDETEQAAFDANVQAWRAADACEHDAKEEILERLDNDRDMHAEYEYSKYYDIMEGVDGYHAGSCRFSQLAPPELPLETLQEFQVQLGMHEQQEQQCRNAVNRLRMARRSIAAFNFLVVSPCDAVAPREAVEGIDKLMEKIFSNLNAGSIGRAGGTCRRWRHASSCEATWQTVVERDLPMLATLQALSARPWRELCVQRALATQRSAPKPEQVDLSDYMYLIGVEVRDVKAGSEAPPLLSRLQELASGNAGTSSFLCRMDVADAVQMTEWREEVLYRLRVTFVCNPNSSSYPVFGPNPFETSEYM